MIATTGPSPAASRDQAVDWIPPPQCTSGRRSARCRTRVWVGRSGTPTSIRNMSFSSLGWIWSSGRRRDGNRRSAHSTRAPRDSTALATLPCRSHQVMSSVMGMVRQRTEAPGPNWGAGQSWSAPRPAAGSEVASAGPCVNPGKASARAPSTVIWTSENILSEPSVSNVA